MKYLIIMSIILSFSVPALWAQSTTGEDRGHVFQELTQALVKAGASSDEAERISRMMEEHRFSDESISSVRHTIEETAREGLPVEPLIHKAFEGIAKHVPEEAIVKAMEKIRHRFEYSYQNARMFTKSKNEQHRLGNILSDCMTASVSENDMNRIVEQLKTRTRNADSIADKALAEQSFLMVRLMARMGVPSDKARDLVCQALKNQYNSNDMINMQNRFSKQAMSGSASQLASDYTSAISHGAKSNNLGGSNGNGSNGFGGSSSSGTGGSRSGGSGSGGSGSGSGGHGGPGGSGGHGRN